MGVDGFNDGLKDGLKDKLNDGLKGLILWFTHGQFMSISWVYQFHNVNVIQNSLLNVV